MKPQIVLRFVWSAKICKPIRLRLGFWLCLCLHASLPAAGQQEISTSSSTSPLPVEAVVSALSLDSEVTLSPDGKLVAYVVKDPRRRKLKQAVRDDQVDYFTATGAPFFQLGCDVWITATTSGKSRKITNGKGTSWAPSWSPDNRYLAFYSDRKGSANLWIWDRLSLKLRRVSGALVRPFQSERILWASDSKSVITKIGADYSTFASGELAKPSNLSGAKLSRAVKRRQTGEPAVLVYSSDPASTLVHSGTSNPPLLMDHFLGDIARIDVISGKVSRITRGLRIWGYSLSPDNSHLVFSAVKVTAASPYDFVYELAVVTIPGQRLRTVKDFSPGIGRLPVSWSPDGKRLSYVSGKDCFVTSMSGLDSLRIRRPGDDGFSGIPVWDIDGRFIYLIGGKTLWRVPVTSGAATAFTDGERAINILSPMTQNRSRPTARNTLILEMRNGETGAEELMSFDTQTGKILKLLDHNMAVNLELCDVAVDGRYLVFGRQDAANDENLWIIDLVNGQHRQLTHINPEFDRYTMGTSRLIEYAGINGEKLQSALLLPAGFEEGKRYPLIVNVYGGERLSKYLNHFGLQTTFSDNMQLFATRGYCVLLPDTPIRRGTPMKDLASTVLPAVDKVIDLGIADPERLGIMGHSYGGYSTLAVIAQTPRFKAAHMDAGLGNLFAHYGVLLENGDPFAVTWSENGQGRMGGSPWEFRERYIENSPLFFLDRIQTPLLITQGALDLAPFLSDEVFVGLRRLGKETAYAKYLDEGHGIEGCVNKVDYYKRVISWFDKFLKPTLR